MRNSLVLYFTVLLALSGSIAAAGDQIQSCLDDLRRIDAQKRKDAQKNAGTQPVYTYHPVNTAELPSQCLGGDLSQIKQALNYQLAKCTQSSLAPVKQIGCRTYTRQEYCTAVVGKMLTLANTAKNYAAFFERAKASFTWYKSDGLLENSADGTFKAGDIQFTAYYAPTALEAHTEPSFEYKYPIFKTPPDLVAAPPDGSVDCGSDSITEVKIKYCRNLGGGKYDLYPTRGEMEAHLKQMNLDRELAIAYLKDPIEIAYLMIQGSGSLDLTYPDGHSENMRINYDAQNGRTSYMIARVLKCLGLGKEIYGSMEGVKSYLRSLPIARQLELLNYNQAYVFFKPGRIGPIGSEGIPVTPKVSFATDRSVIPSGTVLLFNVKHPEGMASECDRITSMGLAQDTGGAIVGAHVDWYMGEGAEAGQLANATNFPGSLYLALVPGTGKEIANCTSH